MKLSTKISLAVVISAHAYIIGVSLIKTHEPVVSDANLTFETIDKITDIVKPSKTKQIIIKATVEKDLFEQIDFPKFTEALKFSESTGRKFVINGGGYLGWFQIGMQRLEDLGYIKKGEYQRMKKSGLGQKTFIKNYVKWNNGLTLNKFLKTKQHEAFARSCKKNYESLKKYDFLPMIKDHKELQGVLFGAHLVGLTATKRWLKGDIKSAKDANGMTIEKYFAKGYNI